MPFDKLRAGLEDSTRKTDDLVINVGYWENYAGSKTIIHTRPVPSLLWCGVTTAFFL